MFVGRAEIATLDYENDAAFRGTDGTWDYVTDDIYTVYVRGDVDCETFTGTMENSSGNTSDGEVIDSPFLTIYDCDDIDMTNVTADSFFSIGIITAEENGTYIMNASDEVFIVGAWAEISEAFGGIMAIMGSFGAICCGAFFLLLGGIFALTLKNPQPTMVMVNNAANPMMPGMAMPVTQMAQPQMQQPVQYQQPAQTQMAQPQYQQPGQPVQQPTQQYQQPPQGGL
jgi:hypothetical protein